MKGVYNFNSDAFKVMLTNVAPVVGNYAISGADAALRAGLSFGVAAGAYSVTGSPANLSVSAPQSVAKFAGGGAARAPLRQIQIAAEGVGAYSIDGASAAMLVTRQRRQPARAARTQDVAIAVTIVAAHGIALDQMRPVVSGSDETHSGRCQAQIDRDNDLMMLAA